MIVEEKQILKKTDNVSIRIDSDLSDKLHKKCAEQKISLNTLINHLLEKQVNWHELTAEMGWVSMFRSTLRELSDSISKEKIECASKLVRKKANTVYLNIKCPSVKFIETESCANLHVCIKENIEVYPKTT